MAVEENGYKPINNQKSKIHVYKVLNAVDSSE